MHLKKQLPLISYWRCCIIFYSSLFFRNRLALFRFVATIADTRILTYLLNGFLPFLTHTSSLLWFLRAYSSWSHQSMTGLPRSGPSNANKVVLFADFRKSPHQIPVSPKHPSPFERHGRASTAAVQRTCSWGAHTSHCCIGCRNSCVLIFIHT